ncbi:hypothetical protein JW890_05525 [candidate division WOR-3 bacterium]|nr:hypothetical protein [candidate division WOR-3 bacterium]
MNNSYIFEKPIGGLIGLTDFTDRWQITLDSHNKKQYRDTILNLLNYLDPDVIKKCGNKKCDEFNIPHGSIIINMKITDKDLEINAPFLSIPDKKVNALLRQLAEINFSVLFLTQIVLEEERLYFRIKVPLQLCEPYKLYDILYEICINADHYDDLFIEKFEAQRIYTPKFIRYGEKESKSFYDSFLVHIKESIDCLEYFREKRWFDIGVESGMISMMKIDYIFSPQGFLRTEIEKAMNDSYAKIPPAEKVENQLKFFKDFSTITFEKFSESIYKTEFLISVRRHASIPVIKKQLENYYYNAEKDIAAKGYLSAVIFLLYDIYNLYYRYLIPKNIEETLNQGLKNSSGKDWKTAADELFKAMSKVMNTQ